jgi:hypothetical protein
MFHITNGDCAAAALARAGIPDEDVLPWRDVLHEGPVPTGLTLDELSSVRAAFIAQCGWGDLDTVREEFRLRDCRLAGLQAEHEAVLWFESDLYDQLQLIQLLDWFAEPAHRPQRLTLVCIDRDPDSGRFEGLGALSKERVAALLESRAPVTDEQLDLGRRLNASCRHAGSARGAWRQSQCLPTWVRRSCAGCRNCPRCQRIVPTERMIRGGRAALRLRASVPCSPGARGRRSGDWSFRRLLAAWRLPPGSCVRRFPAVPRRAGRPASRCSRSRRREGLDWRAR